MGFRNLLEKLEKVIYSKYYKTSMNLVLFYFGQYFGQIGHTKKMRKLSSFKRLSGSRQDFVLVFFLAAILIF